MDLLRIFLGRVKLLCNFFRLAINLKDKIREKVECERRNSPGSLDVVRHG